MGTRCADQVTPLYPQKLALTSPTGGGRSVDIDRVRIKATEYRLVTRLKSKTAIIIACSTEVCVSTVIGCVGLI